MSRRRRRSSWPPSSASVPWSVSNRGNETTEDSNAEHAPLHVPQPRSLKRPPLVAVVALAVAITAGVVPLKVWSRPGPGSGSAVDQPVARSRPGPPIDAHGQLPVMTGKSSLDTPRSDSNVLESMEYLIQSTDDAVQAGLQKERSAASSPDFFFPKGAANVGTRSRYARSSGEPLVRKMMEETESTLTHRSGEVPNEVIEPTCATGAMTWMHADGQTLVVEEPTDLARSTPLAPDGHVLSVPADLSSTMSAGQVSQRTMEASEISAGGIEMLPSRPPSGSIEHRLRAPTKVDPWVGLLSCSATFPEVITAWDEAEMMASSPPHLVEDVQTADVTAIYELLLETPPSCAVAGWRTFFSDSHSLDDSGPPLLAPGHETTAPITGLVRASVVTPPPFRAVVLGILPAKAEEPEQSTRCLSPQVDELAVALSEGSEGTVRDEKPLEAPLSSASEIAEGNGTEAGKVGDSKLPLPTQEDEGPAVVKRGDWESTEGEVALELSRISEPVLLGTKLTETAVAGEPARCPRAVLGAPFFYVTAFLERVPTEVEAGAQLTCPLPVEGDEPAAADMGQDREMPSDEAASNTIQPSAASTLERISAGAEARGMSTQFPPPQDESTKIKVGEGRVSPLALQYCPATLLRAISAERDTATAVCSSSLNAEYGPTATIPGGVEDTTDADALLYRGGAAAGDSTTKVDAETRSTASVLVEDGPANADTGANDETLETLSCLADVPLAIFLGEAEIQTDTCPLLFMDTPEATEFPTDGASANADSSANDKMLKILSCPADVPQAIFFGEANTCPLLLANTPEATEVPTDGVSLFRIALPSWATGVSATCSVDGAVGEESTSYLPLEGVTTTAQAPRDAETQGKADSRAATVPKMGLSQAEGKEVDQPCLEMLVREFNSWIRSITFPVRKIEAGVVPNGMRAGLIATETLADGETYLVAPESITMDVSKAREDPELGPPLGRIRTHLSPIGLWDDELDSLRVLLIAETFSRAGRSFWAPYVRLLPTLSDIMSYHPLFFDDTAVASLEGSDVQAALRKRRYSEVEAFNSKFVDDKSAVLELEDVLGEGWITLDRYLWATAVLDSRMIWWDGRKHLVPLLDLVNNAQGPRGTLVQETVQDAEGNAVATTTQSFETGTQVLENYGHANHILFLYHGFSLGRENRHDCVWVAPQRLPRGPGHKLMLARMKEAFPGGRPSFCISLDKYGPYDFASYVRIATGLPAFPEPPLDTGEPYSGREVDEASCQRSTEEGSAERSVHERWEILRHDPQGLAAVVAYLETRLSKYPRSLVWGGDGGRGGCGSGDGCSCGGSGGENVWAATENGGDACGAMTAQGESRKFLDSEQHLLQEILDYLVPLAPGSLFSEHDHQKDKVAMTEGVLAGNYSQEDTPGDVNKRTSGYDDGNSQASPVS